MIHHTRAGLNVGFGSEKIDERVLAYLARQDWPVTTEMVAKELQVSWNTAQLHLYKLLSQGLVKGRRVGRQNQWVIIEKAKEQKRTTGRQVHDRDA